MYTYTYTYTRVPSGTASWSHPGGPRRCVPLSTRAWGRAVLLPPSSSNTPAWGHGASLDSPWREDEGNVSR
eukprot:2923830-Pyramimonas_sp.AAC.1